MGFDYRTYTGLGKQTLRKHKQNLVRTRTQEKGAVTPQETDSALPVSVQESLAEAWVRMTCFRVRGAESWSQVKQQGENTAPPINRILD